MIFFFLFISEKRISTFCNMYLYISCDNSEMIVINDQWDQKYSRLRCLLRVKALAICFYLGWSGSILQFRQNIIKVGSKSWLLTCSSNITLSLPSYAGSALKRELNFCNGYLSLLYFCVYHCTELCRGGISQFLSTFCKSKRRPFLYHFGA